ncbi:hypothetical protein HOE67_03045 [Candidatus Peregrinibacteria bacterium]|jgi:hypothetical protein|nr:hypothetical protein [Candidatus Peregrinibacteria bacterium]MBT4056062.1 hypothetical protein [Candidatus Peregrinibacteria bacterium]
MKSKNTHPNTSGETLIEVITAITTIVMAGIASVSVIIASFNSTTISREYLIAQNLAREAIEGVTNIRDTNWLLYPDKKEACWLVLPQFSGEPHDTCQTKEKVSDTIFYVVARHPVKGNFIFAKNNDELDLETEPNPTTYGMFYDIVTEQYTHGTTENLIWYRMVKFEQVDEAPFADQVKVTVKVQWKGSKDLGTYEVSSILTNYAK